MDKQLAEWSVAQIKRRCQILNDNSRIMKSDVSRLILENKTIEGKIKENNEKIKMNKQLPYLVANVIEVKGILLSCASSYTLYCPKILDFDEDGKEDDGANVDLNSSRKDKCVVVKTSTRQV